jgi:hypothetical protein
MTVDLEERLERAAEALPAPSDAARAEAQSRALAALPRASRRTSRRRLGVVALSGAAAAVLALLLASPWEGRSPLATERALAALGDRPVIHAIVENLRPHATIVDLASGVERQQLLRTEYWYDEERALLRTRLSIDGHLLTELLQTREAALSDLGPLPGNAAEPRLDPALAGFASRYREALESGTAEVAGDAYLDDRRVILLRFTLPSPQEGQPLNEEVAIDAESFRPLRFRFHYGADASPWSRVLSIETLEREDGQFTPPQPRPEPRPRRATGLDERTLTPDEAHNVLGRSALWPGADVEGIALTEIELMKVTTEWSDGRETQAKALVLQYGEGRRADPSGRWLVVTEGTSAEIPRFGTFGATPLDVGELRLVGLDSGLGEGRKMWFGSLERDGLYFAFESPHRDLVLAAARALTPIG